MRRTTGTSILPIRVFPTILLRENIFWKYRQRESPEYLHYSDTDNVSPLKNHEGLSRIVLYHLDYQVVLLSLHVKYIQYLLLNKNRWSIFERQIFVDYIAARSTFIQN